MPPPLLQKGKPVRQTHKSLLPTYDVFDEDRYFERASRVEAFDLAGKKSASPFARIFGPNIISPVRFTMSNRCEG